MSALGSKRDMAGQRTNVRCHPGSGPEPADPLSLVSAKSRLAQHLGLTRGELSLRHPSQMKAFGQMLHVAGELEGDLGHHFLDGASRLPLQALRYQFPCAIHKAKIRTTPRHHGEETERAVPRCAIEIRQ